MEDKFTGGTQWIRTGPDGESFDTSGPLRVEPRGEHFFVVGLGLLRLVPSIHEGNQLIRDINNGAWEVRDGYVTSSSYHYIGAVDWLLPLYWL